LDLEEYRRNSRSAWDRIAPVWDREREFHTAATGLVSERVIERLDPKPGETVLEIAAGTGEEIARISERLGEGGTLLCTDFSPAMVDVARAESQRLGLVNVEHRVLDAERMDLEDARVDRAACRFGYMLMANPAAALAETRRVLRDSGRLAFAVWAPAERNAWAAIPAQTMIELGHAPTPEPGAPGAFAMADPGTIGRLLDGAGFGEPMIDEVPVRWGYSDAGDYWRRTITLSGSMADRLAELPEVERERARQTVLGRAEARLAEADDGLDGLALVVTVEPPE
jgi:ubiquinone/menaquinone biosynthesis C-methylase UbiE